MSSAKSSNQPGLFTVGHSNVEQAAFLDLLQQAQIQVLVDVRSAPYSRYVPHFNTDELRPALESAGIKYLFMGKELGGRPEGAQFYDDEGYALYHRIAQSPVFLEGVRRLKAGITRYRVAMMCSEEDPTVCHRHLLVARVLADAGVAIQHIRADGSLQSYEELAIHREKQHSLFDDGEDDSWKSIRSVLPRSRPPSSSASSDVMGSSD